VWKGKRVAVIGGSPGPSGTRSAQFAWWPILRVLGARIHPDVLSVHGVASGFVDGRPTEELARRLTDFAVTLSTAP
jgi:NAD(P)H-dependent FMN reductase